MMASSKGRAELREVPVGFFARRVKALVESGKLESDGNLVSGQPIHLDARRLDDVVPL